MAGLQCSKRLYLQCFHHELADPIDDSRQAIFDMGTGIGELARDLFPGGVLISDHHFHHYNAVKSTTKALSDSSLSSVYEAGFIYDDVRVRVDILARAGQGKFDLIEVKSNTKVKEEHLSDAAIQLYVLEGCGLQISRVCIAHINKDYLYQGGDYDLNDLFSLDDITAEVRVLLEDIPSILKEMKLYLGVFDPPAVKISRHCNQPYECPFYSYCHADEPEHHVRCLPRAGKKLLQSLADAGIDDIRDIPAGFTGLNEIQQRVRDCVTNGCTYLDRHALSELDQLKYPVHFLDFETFNPALPLYTGTNPYQIIPFQWSNHIIDEDGVIRHEEFLYDRFDDPREAFATSLINTLGECGSIIVYSSFEEMLIRKLAATLPHMSGALQELLNGRIVDLLKIINAYCYHPEFHGSFSLKSVLPALVPDLDYSDLDIREGGRASAAYSEIVNPDTLYDQRELLRQNLLAYCERDTEAMLRLFQVLKSGRIPGIAGTGRG